jgi:hypothetical protein
MSLRTKIGGLTRREWMKLSAVSAVGYSFSGWFEAFAEEAAKNPARKKSVILLWMNGGPSQMDTFDLKPGHANGGPYKAIETAVPGIRISEHLPRLASNMKDMVLVRSMATKEADHSRGTFLMHTGHAPGGPIQYPPIGSLMSKELGNELSELPNFVSVAPYRIFSPGAYTPGFLGPLYAPLIVGDGTPQFNQQGQPANNYEQQLKVKDMDLPESVTRAQAEARVKLLEDMEKDFSSQRPGIPSQSHKTAYERAVKMMRSAAAAAFNLDEEKNDLRDKYGRTLFGQGCLLARRLVERGVSFVEVSLSSVTGVQNGALGWDTHGNNFVQVKALSEALDAGWGTLMEDLRSRGLLEHTMIVWMGEFGRTPRINQGQGRDHWANSWSTVIAGGGLKGGQVVGKTSADGMTVEERPVSVGDFLATVVMAAGIDPKKRNMSNVNRPISIVEPGAKAITEVVKEVIE